MTSWYAHSRLYCPFAFTKFTTTNVGIISGTMPCLPFIQVAIPTVGKSESRTLPQTSTNHSGPVSASAETSHQPPLSSSAPASADTTHEDQISASPGPATVTLPPAPYTLLPGYVSRPQAPEPTHPLPSEPLIAAVSLQSTGPSLHPGVASDPQHHQPIKEAVQNPSQSALWADLAAELRSAPLSAQSLQATAGVQLEHTAPAHQAADLSPGSAEQRQSVHASEPITQDPNQPAASQLRQKQQTRRKLATAEPSGASAGEDESSQPKQKPPRSRRGTKAATGKGKAKGSTKPAAAQTDLEAEAHHAETLDRDQLREDDASRADPARQAKNAAFKGSGALGLSRRLSSRLLTPQEVTIMGKLPLPPALHRLEEVLFPPVNGMYGFLLRQHIQVTTTMLISNCFPGHTHAHDVHSE